MEGGAPPPGPRGIASRQCWAWAVGPKLGGDLLLSQADELKVILPGVAPGATTPGWSDDALVDLGARGSWTHKFVNPQDGHPDASRRVVQFVTSHAHLGWRAGVQAHKVLGLR